MTERLLVLLRRHREGLPLTVEHCAAAPVDALALELGRRSRPEGQEGALSSKHRVSLRRYAWELRGEDAPRRTPTSARVHRAGWRSAPPAQRIGRRCVATQDPSDSKLDCRGSHRARCARRQPHYTVRCAHRLYSRDSVCSWYLRCDRSRPSQLRTRSGFATGRPHHRCADAPAAEQLVRWRRPLPHRVRWRPVARERAWRFARLTHVRRRPGWAACVWRHVLMCRVAAGHGSGSGSGAGSAWTGGRRLDHLEGRRWWRGVVLGSRARDEDEGGEGGAEGVGHIQEVQVPATFFSLFFSRRRSRSGGYPEAC